jgi:hypothetical protein
MNDDEINRRIAEAEQKIRQREIEGGARNPGDVLAYGNPDVINFKPMKRLPYAEKVNELYGQTLGAGEKPFSKTALGGPVTGLTEGGANWLSSAANVPLGMLGMYTEPTDLSQYLNYEPGVEGNINRYGYVGGNIAGTVLPDILSYLGGSSLIKGMSGIPGMTARTGLGAGIGYIGGEHGPGGRAGGAAIGTAGSLFGEAQAPRIVGRLEAQLNKETEKLAPKYQSLLNKLNQVDYPANNAGINTFRGKNANYKLSKDADDALTKFEQTLDPNDAKKAISKLKADQRALRIGKYSDPKSMVGERRRRYEALDDAINAIEQNVEDAFVKQNMLLELGKMGELDKLYKSNVTPYLFDELLSNTSGAANAPSSVIEKILKMKKGSEKLPSGMNAYEYIMKKNPEIFLNKMIPKITPERTFMAALLSGLMSPLPSGDIAHHGGD